MLCRGPSVVFCRRLDGRWRPQGLDGVRFAQHGFHTGGSAGPCRCLPFVAPSAHRCTMRSAAHTRDATDPRGAIRRAYKSGWVAAAASLGAQCDWPLHELRTPVPLRGWGEGSRNAKAEDSGCWLLACLPAGRLLAAPHSLSRPPASAFINGILSQDLKCGASHNMFVFVCFLIHRIGLVGHGSRMVSPNMLQCVSSSVATWFRVMVF